MNTIFICPKCGGALTVEEKRAVCPSGHSYDRAREGYFNLLLGASAGTHGDNAEMVAARRAFLESGGYDFLADAVAQAVKTYLPEGGAVLDGGAGECYYTEKIAKALEKRGDAAKVYAFDISKDAVKLAAKRKTGISLAVAGVYRMPVAAGSVDVFLNLFAPFAKDEIQRVLRTRGYLIMAIPEREHLFGLKAAVYDTPYPNEVADTAIEGFSLLESRELRKTVTLSDRETIAALFGMTPYAYRTSAEGRARVAALDRLTTDFHFRLLVYRKDAE